MVGSEEVGSDLGAQVSREEIRDEVSVSLYQRPIWGFLEAYLCVL